jgi:Uma2 family endonuclease
VVPVKAVLVEVPQSLLEERRRRGADVFDEMWDGVLHMNPPPSGEHQRFGTRLLAALLPVAEALGLDTSYETGLNNHPQDYRSPNLAVYRPEHRIEAGISGADLVIEILSPGDETYDKLDWYVDRGVSEVLVADPTTRRVELFRSVGERPVLVQADDDGRLALTTLAGVSLATVETPDGPRLRVTTADTAVDI